MEGLTVDWKGVAKLLGRLNVHKASGPDGLNARVLKECSNEISPILALIYDESLAWSDVPDTWRQANVSPVFKKGENMILLTTGCCHSHAFLQNPRAYSIVSSINKHLALDSILADCQHGFRS